MGWPRPEPEIAQLPVIYVAGLGRCGSTLTMNMLAAGGVPCVGEAPAYEVDQVNHRAPEAAWLRSQRGRAVKLLDPHHCSPLPDVPAIAIWLDRDVAEQARSQAKFAHLVGGLPKASRTHIRAMSRSLLEERAVARTMALAGVRKLTLTFEGILADPYGSAENIALFLAPWFHGLRVDAMATVVLPRSPACAPDLSIELSLIEAAHG